MKKIRSIQFLRFVKTGNENWWLNHKGGNLDCTSRVICVCWYQISRFFNFGGHFYYSNFSSWSNESALRFFDFALFHGQNQVLSLFVTFRHFFNNNLDCTSRVICACWYQILRFFNFGGHFYYSNFLRSSNESALRFFDFALFHGFFQVLSLFVTLEKMEESDFWKVSCTRGHEN